MATRVSYDERDDLPECPRCGGHGIQLVGGRAGVLPCSYCGGIVTGPGSGLFRDRLTRPRG